MSVQVKQDRDALACYPKSYSIPGEGDICIRPITPEDIGIEDKFVRNLSAESRYLRFFYGLKGLTPAMLSRFTHNHYPHDVALIATITDSPQEVEIGVARFAESEREATAEFAVVVDDHWQGKGIGSFLIGELVSLAMQAGFERLEGLVLRDNNRMRRLLVKLGFKSQGEESDPSLVCIYKNLCKNGEQRRDRESTQEEARP